MNYPRTKGELEVTTMLRVYVPHNQYSRAFDFKWEGERDPLNVDVPNLGAEANNSDFEYPFAFQFYSVAHMVVEPAEGSDEVMMETPGYNPSPMYYIRGRVLHLEQIREKYLNHEQAIANLERFEHKHAVKDGSRYYPFTKGTDQFIQQYADDAEEADRIRKTKGRDQGTDERGTSNRTLPTGQADDPARTPRKIRNPRQKARERLAENDGSRLGALSPEDAVTLLPKVARQDSDPGTKKTPRKTRRVAGRKNAGGKGNPPKSRPKRRKGS